MSLPFVIVLCVIAFGAGAIFSRWAFKQASDAVTHLPPDQRALVEAYIAKLKKQ